MHMESILSVDLWLIIEAKSTLYMQCLTHARMKLHAVLHLCMECHIVLDTPTHAAVDRIHAFSCIHPRLASSQEHMH